MYNYHDKFPYILRDDEYFVLGNVLDVDDEELAELDRYEGLATNLYTREKAWVVKLDDEDEEERVEVYVAASIAAYPVDHGDWANA